MTLISIESVIHCHYHPLADFKQTKKKKYKASLTACVESYGKKAKDLSAVVKFQYKKAKKTPGKLRYKVKSAIKDCLDCSIAIAKGRCNQVKADTYWNSGTLDTDPWPVTMVTDSSGNAVGKASIDNGYLKEDNSGKIIVINTPSGRVMGCGALVDSKKAECK